MSNLQPHQQRLLAEKQELDARLGRLLTFFKGPVFVRLPEIEKLRLRHQARFMEGYAAILEERVEALIP
jgi:hypothetical protein